MLKCIRKNEILVRNLVSFVGLAVLAMAFLSIWTNVTLQQFQEEEYRTNLNEKLSLVMSNMDSYLKSAHKTAVSMSVSTEFDRKVFTRHKYYEVKLLDSLYRMRSGVGLECDYFVMYEEQPEVIFRFPVGSNCGVLSLTETYFDALDMDDIDVVTDELFALRSAGFVRAKGSGERLLLAAPFVCKSNRNCRAVVCWILSEGMIRDLITLMTGGLGDCFTFYCDEIPLVDGDIQDTQKNVVRLAHGRFMMNVDIAFDPLYRAEKSVSGLSYLTICIFSLLLLANGIALAIYNYYPLHRMIQRYKPHARNEFGGLEEILNDAYKKIQRDAEQSVKQCMEQRHYALLLLLNGIWSPKVEQVIGIFPDKLAGPFYTVAAVRLGSKGEENIALPEDMVDSLGNVYLCSWVPGMDYLLFSMGERETNDAISELKELLAEYEYEYRLGVSEPCDNLELVCKARKQAEQKLSNVDFDVHDEGTSDEKIAEIREYINKTAFEWNFSLTNCAEACGINANYLCSRFKNVYGVSFHSYVTKVRIDEAKRLLVESSMTVRKIGEKVGYLNLSHFIRVFRESEGCTPGIYRKK